MLGKQANSNVVASAWSPPPELPEGWLCVRPELRETLMSGPIGRVHYWEPVNPQDPETAEVTLLDGTRCAATTDYEIAVVGYFTMKQMDLPIANRRASFERE